MTTKGAMMNRQDKKQQRGGTILGFVLGLVAGLGLALAVAVYITKVPIPFVNKAISRSAEQDATEVKKNKDWDPNAPLYGKNPAKPAAPAEAVEPVPVPAAAPPAPMPAAKASVAKIEPAKTEAKTAAAADPLGDLARAKAAVKAGAPDSAEPFSYFVQLGAFRTVEDAETHRAKLSLAGVETKISERDQAGRTVYRVRTGPYDKRDEADKAKAKLDALGMETALVRVQR
jgi:cell division protein FtsN